MTTSISAILSANSNANLGDARTRVGERSVEKFSGAAFAFEGLGGEVSSSALSSSSHSSFSALINRLGAIDAALSGSAGGSDTSRILSEEDVIGEAQRLTDSLFANPTQTLFGTSHVNSSGLNSVSDVADTLHQFKGVLKQFENLLDAAFKRPRGF